MDVMIPLKRAGTPEDVAGTALFLASRAGAYVNGTSMISSIIYVLVNLSLTAATITLDGGMTSAYPHARL